MLSVNVRKDHIMNNHKGEFLRGIVEQRTLSVVLLVYSARKMKGSPHNCAISKWMVIETL